MKDFTDAIAVLEKAAADERMKSSIASMGSFADVYCAGLADRLEAAIEELMAVSEK